MPKPDDLQAFLAKHATPYDPSTDAYRRPPFAAPVKAGKNTSIYNAHSYHTKVPPQGIVPYILHYTDPGDLILDPFCGSGMAGVAALMCVHHPAKALHLTWTAKSETMENTPSCPCAKSIGKFNGRKVYKRS